MRFNRRFHESESIDWDAIARKDGKYTSLEDMAEEYGSDAEETKDVLDIITTCPSIGDDTHGFIGDKDERKKIAFGIIKAANLNYIRNVYTIVQCSESSYGTLAIDMDIDKVADLCGLSRNEFLMKTGIEMPFPTNTDTLEWGAGLCVKESVNDIDEMIGHIFTYTGLSINNDEYDEVYSNIDESTKRAVNAQISNLKESIYKAQKTLARLQRK